MTQICWNVRVCLVWYGIWSTVLCHHFSWLLATEVWLLQCNKRLGLRASVQHEEPGQHHGGVPVACLQTWPDHECQWETMNKESFYPPEIVFLDPYKSNCFKCSNFLSLLGYVKFWVILSYIFFLSWRMISFSKLHERFVIRKKNIFIVTVINCKFYMIKNKNNCCWKTLWLISKCKIQCLRDHFVCWM